MPTERQNGYWSACEGSRHHSFDGVNAVSFIVISLVGLSLADCPFTPRIVQENFPLPPIKDKLISMRIVPFVRQRG